MRLKLNRTLRAALIAAISAAGFTLSQAQAADITLANIMNVGAAADTDITTTVWGNAAGVINTASAQYHITNGGQTPGATGYTNSILATRTNVGTGGTYTYTLTFTTGTLEETTTLSAINVDFVTYNGSGFGHNQSTSMGVNMINCAWTLTDVTGATMSNIELPDNGAIGQGTAVYTKSGDSYTTNNFTGATAKIDFDDITLTSEKTYTLTLAVSKAGGANGFFVGIGNIALVNTPEVVTTTWIGTPEHSTWSDAQAWDNPPSANMAAVFNGNAEYKTVSVEAATTVESITVDSAAYTFNIGEDASLSTAELTITGTEASLAVAGDGAVNVSSKLTCNGSLSVGSEMTIASLSGAGDLTAGEGSNVTVSALGDYTGNLSVTDGGTLVLAGQLSGAYTKDITVTGGTLSIAGGTSGDNFHTIIVEAGGTYDLKGKGGTDYRLRYTLDGGILTNTGSATGAGNIQNDQITLLSNSEVSGTADFNMIAPGFNTSYLNLDNHKLTKTGANTIHLYNTHVNAGEIEVQEGAVNFRTDKTTSEVAADIILNGGNVTGKVKYTADTKLQALTTSETALAVELNGHTLTLDAAADATLTMTGAVTGSGSLVKTGDGAATIGGTIALTQTIQAQGGTLTLTGSYAIDNISGGGLIEDFVDNTGATAASGFSRKSGSVTVYKEDGGKVDFTDATFTLGSSTVTPTAGVVAIDPTVDYTTLYVNKRTAVDFAAHQAYAQSQGSGITGVVLKNETTVENVSGTVGVTLAEGATRATVHASGATTISGISGWSNNELVIQGDGEVTMAGQTLTGSQKLQVAGTVSTTGALTVNGETASLVVNRNATLNVTGNMTPVHGSVLIQGEVNISSELDLSKGKTSDVVLNIDSTGKVSANGMWMHSSSSIMLQEDGEFDIAGLSIVGKDGGGITYLGAAGTDSPYATGNANYQISNATVTSTGNNVTLGNTLVNTDVVVADGSSLTLNTNAVNVTVQNGGTFTLNEGKTVTTINVEDGGTIAGGVDAKDVGIAAHGTATFDEGVNDEQAGIAIAGWDSGATVTNNGDSTAKYAGLQDENMTVSAEELYSLAESEIVVNNELKVGAIIHCGEGALTLTNVNGDALEAVQTETAALVLQGITETTLTEMAIGIGASVAVYTDSSKETEGTVTIDAGCILTAGEGSTLYANLVLEEGATWNLMGSSMNLGSTLQLATLITLDDATLQNLDDDLGVGQFYALARDASGNGITYLGQTGVDAWYDGVFSRQGEHYTLEGDFYLDVRNGDFGLVKVSKTPEPTTGTLSLLALCALAARRRRK